MMLSSSSVLLSTSFDGMVKLESKPLANIYCCVFYCYLLLYLLAQRIVVAAATSMVGVAANTKYYLGGNYGDARRQIRSNFDIFLCKLTVAKSTEYILI
jgi:hypothetical protein